MKISELVEKHGLNIKIRLSDWFGPGSYFNLLGFTPGGVYIGYYERGVPAHFSDDYSDDWELYVKPKKKLYKWALEWFFNEKESCIIEADAFFENESEVYRRYDSKNFKVLKRLDYTEIEVEGKT